MAITWVAESAAGATAGGDPVVTKPVGLAVNDLMLATGVTTTTATITPPGTWSTHPDSLSTSRPLFYKVADAGDVAAANFTFVTSGAANAIVVISAYRGVNPVTPFTGTAGVVSTSSTTVTITAANPAVPATLAQLVAKLNLNTWTPPGTVSPERWDHTISTVGSTAGGHESVAAGSTGTRTWTASTGAAAGLGYSVPLLEASQTLSVSGFAPAVAFGTVTLVQDQFVTPSGFTPSVAFGTPTLVQDQFLTVTGFAPDVDFGTPGIQQTVTPSGFTVPVQFGTPTLIPDQLVEPGGFEVSVLFGTPTLRQSIPVDGFTVPVLFGDPTVILDNVLMVSGFTPVIQFGTVTLTSQPFVTATVYDHETGLPVGAGATVQLFNAVTGELIDTTTTDAGGVYLFHLPQGFTDDVFTVVRVEINGTEYQGVSEVCPVQT